MAFLLAVTTFTIVFVILLLAFSVSQSGRQRELIRRLEAIEKAQSRGSASLQLKLVRDELLSDVPLLNRVLLRWSWAKGLRHFLTQAGMRTRPGKLILMSGVVAAGSYVAVYQFYRNPLFAVLGCAVGALIPFGFVAFKRLRRLRDFEKNFPEAIDLLARAVRAGHAFTTGMEMIGKELPEPVSGEFRITFDEQNFGLPLKDAFLNLTERVPLIDVRFFVTALLIQKETGGNLAEILDNLSRVVRERFKILGEVRVKTAQGRLTAAILIALPPMMMVVMKTLNPDYTNLLFTDPMGPYMLAGAAVLQVVGSALLWKIVHIEV